MTDKEVHDEICWWVGLTLSPEHHEKELALAVIEAVSKWKQYGLALHGDLASENPAA